jgi:hypothetical protein
MKNASFRQWAAALALVGAGSLPASAALITLNGSNIDVIYDDAQPTLLAFGTPTLVGDLITFSPSNFKALAINGGLDIEANTVNLKIVVRDGYRVQSIDFSEGGDYVMWGAGSFVSVGGQTRVFDTAQVPPGIIKPLAATGLGTVNMVQDLTTTNWTASTFSDLSGAPFANTRELSFSVQNLLAAFAATPQGGDPSLALIEKKFVAIDVNVSPIPEPEAWAMMLIGAGLVGFRLRNRSKKTAAQRFA